nr:transmembrane protein LIL11 [Polypedilum vanderplanki]
MGLKKFIKDDSFLGFFDLQTGGIIIGAIGLFSAIVQITTEYILLLSLFFVDSLCLQLHFPKSNFNLNILAKSTEDDIANVTDLIQTFTNKDVTCGDTDRIPLALILIAGILINITSIIAHYRIIKGVEEHNATRFSFGLKYYKFFIGLRGFLLILLIIWSFSSIRFIFYAFSMLALLVTDIYIYIILDKLWEKYLIHPPKSIIVLPPVSQVPNHHEDLFNLNNFGKTENEMNGAKSNLDESKSDSRESFRYIFENESPTMTKIEPQKNIEKPRIQENISEVFIIDNSKKDKISIST